MNKPRGRRRVAALVVAIAVLAIACGGPPVPSTVVFNKTTYNDGTRNVEVLAVENGRVFATLTEGETAIDFSTVRDSSIEVTVGTSAVRHAGRLESKATTSAQVSFPIDAVQDPLSTEPAQLKLCVFFDTVATGETEQVEGSACEEVFVPPARGRPQPTPAAGGGGGSSAPPTVSRWRNITASVGTAPSPRAQPSMAELPNGDVLLFGGTEDTGGGPTLVGDTWRFDGAGWTPLTPATSPSARSDAAMAFDGTNVVLFGGSTAGGPLNDTWIWDDTAGNWVDVTATAGTPPSARSGAAMASKGTGSTLNGAVLFGGVAGGFPTYETWVWDAATKTWTDETDFAAPHPDGLAQASMAYDRLTSRVVLHGGEPTPGSADAIEETWKFDPATATWTDVTGAAPGKRSYADMAPSDHDEPIVLYGGYNATALTDRTDYWSGSQWVQITTPGNPPARSSHGMATFTGGSTYALMFGGHGPGPSFTFLAETWVYDPTP